MPTVLTNNPPTPRRSSNIPQTTSGTKPGPSGVQQQNTTGTRSLDEAVDQVLMKAKSPLGEGEVRRVVETLEKMLDHKYPIAMCTRRRCFQSDIEKLGESPVSSGGFSDVWPGVHEGEKAVAIKVIRHYESDDAQKIKKAGHFDLFLARSTLTVYRTSVERSSPGSGNILVSEDGRACLADVGLARVAGDSGSTTQRGSPTKKSDIHSIVITVYEVLTDRIPFYEYKDLVAMLHITQGAMTTSRWKEEPTERPTVDYILEVLKMAAEQWNRRAFYLSPSDDWSSTLSAEESDSSESEDEPFMTNSRLQSPPHSPLLALTPFVLPPSTTWIVEAPEFIHAASEKEGMQPTFTRAPKEEEPRSTSVTSREDGVKPMLVGLPREEEHKSISATPKEAEIWPVPAGLPKEESMLIPATSKKEGADPVSISSPREVSFEPTPTTPRKEKTSPVPVRLSRDEEPAGTGLNHQPPPPAPNSDLTTKRVIAKARDLVDELKTALESIAADPYNTAGEVTPNGMAFLYDPPPLPNSPFHLATSKSWQDSLET
ncbi:hypothetical protein BDM02DRAFT_3182057 [Thelephora ganbajun]|uniref:Uncharacterized protein n=1 Tax=Thelephora ganbajun TaxID=370292 RepID=A0ACB6ZX57_THEGA|nr:hypothetical protein BDM02DRAFT_3182057 [Thelephora ganbajun]